jgi:hypothetical protein
MPGHSSRSTTSGGPSAARDTRDTAAELATERAASESLRAKNRELQAKLDALRRAKAAETRVVKGSTVS